jgi:hypothetical protein
MVLFLIESSLASSSLGNGFPAGIAGFEQLVQSQKVSVETL